MPHNESDENLMSQLTLGYQGVAQNWECDGNAHLNVSFYFGRSSDQAFFMRRALGLRPSEMRAQNRGTVALEEHVRFHNEVVAGGQMIGRSAPVELSNKTMRVYHEFRDTHGVLQASFSTLIGHFDTQNRRLVPWRDETRAAFEAQAIALPASGEPKFLTPNGRVNGISLDTTLKDGFSRTGGAGINSWECDQFGHMNTMFYVRRINEAAPHAWTAAGVNMMDNMADGFSSVVGEMCMSYASELHEGDVVETYSHMMELADKTILIEHRLFNGQTGALSAVGRVRAISFSHKTRRACPWPEATRAAFEAYVNR